MKKRKSGTVQLVKNRYDETNSGQDHSLLNSRVYAEISKIPKGTVITYKELAHRVKNPKAIRRIATIVGQNKKPIIIPCHRVVRSNYTVGEYTYKGKRNQKKKINLLKSEGLIIIGQKVIY